MSTHSNHNTLSLSKYSTKTKFLSVALKNGKIENNYVFLPVFDNIVIEKSTNIPPVSIDAIKNDPQKHEFNSSVANVISKDENFSNCPPPEEEEKIATGPEKKGKVCIKKYF